MFRFLGHLLPLVFLYIPYYDTSSLLLFMVSCFFYDMPVGHFKETSTKILVIIVIFGPSARTKAS